MLQKPTLLIVTEQFSIISWLREELGGEFYLLEAESLRDALSLLSQALVDLLIVDGALPSALDVCSQLRQKLTKRLTPILLITGRLKRDFRDTAFLHGVTDFLSDQLDTDELHTRIATNLKMLEAEEKISDLSMLIPIPTAQISEGYFENRFLLHDRALRFLANAKDGQFLLLFIRVDQANQFDAITLNELTLAISKEINKTIGAENLLLPSSQAGEFILLLKEVQSGMQMAISLQRKISSTSFHTQRGPLSITVSIALGSAKGEEAAFNEMVEAASKALSASSNNTNLILPLNKDFS